MNDFVNLLAIFVSSVITSMGLGGGSFYILYLTFFTDTEQFTAQGYNLLIFLPCAVISVLVYAGKKIISFKYILPIILLLGLLSATQHYLILAARLLERCLQHFYCCPASFPS